MPRQAKLRKKQVGKTKYWYTEAGGPTRFGNVKDVPYSAAIKLFNKHVKSVSDGTKSRNILSTAELIDLFLQWVKENRSPRTYSEKKSHLNKFGNYKVDNRKIADIPAQKLKDSDLTKFLNYLKKTKKLEPTTLLHYETSIKHCFNWGSKNPSPNSHLPPTYRPFASVERTKVDKKVLTEETLITDEEIDILFKAAEFDLDTLHRFGPKEEREQNPYESFADMLRCYFHTGARTGELAKIEVGDLLTRTRQVILGKHKTSETQRIKTTRILTLNDEAMSIFENFTKGKNKKDKIFTNSDGKPWKSRSIPARFVRIKEIAEEQGIGKVRDEITIYDFRHLWISEALMAGNDVATVARMAGTSIAMIESTYGHFRNEHLHEAQAKLDEARRKRRPKPR